MVECRTYHSPGTLCTCGDSFLAGHGVIGFILACIIVCVGYLALGFILHLCTSV